MANSEVVTRGVRVRVESQLVPERSSPEKKAWLFTYHVTIANEGTDTVQLLSRNWQITDANGRVEKVEGPGVVGKKQVLGPGETFEYHSFCPLSTSFGIMHGTYQMLVEDGTKFEAEIAAFQLGEPEIVH